MMKRLHGAVSLAFALTTAWPLVGQAIERGDQHGVAYVTGGVGQDESTAMRNMSKDYSLRLLAADKSGEYLADVRVTIRDGSGKNVLSVTTQGPYLLARLAPGAYRIDAAYGSAQQSRQVRVPQSGQVDASFYF